MVSLGEGEGTEEEAGRGRQLCRRERVRKNGNHY